MRFDVCQLELEKLENNVGPEPMAGVRLDSTGAEEEEGELEKLALTNTSGRTL